MKTEGRNKGVVVLTICVLLFLSSFALCNIKLTSVPLRQLYNREISFHEFVENIQESYISDDFTHKNSFINLNGLFARITGRRVYNETVLTNNGMLAEEYKKIDVAPLANGMVELKNYLENSETKFLYVQEPNKSDLGEAIFPEGVKTYANENADELLKRLKEEGVSTFDLRPYLSATPDMLEEYFFVTDHHWNYEGAFVAYQEIVKQIQGLFPEEKLDTSYVQWENWEAYTLDNWFLGSRGKRVGSLFVGADDLTYYTPLFDTKISCAVPNKRVFYKGDFTDALIHQKYIEEKNYFDYNAYCLYIGGSYPEVQIRNSEAVSDLQLVIIGDSFAMPVYTYLSTIFAKVDVVDPRYSLKCTIAEYVDRAQPDLVITLISPDVFEREEYYNLGVSELVEEKRKQSVEQIAIDYQNVVIEARDTTHNYKALALDPGRMYTLSFEDLLFTEGEADGAIVSLYNETTKKVIDSVVFDVEFCRKYNEFEWIFKVPDSQEEYSLVLYAGIAGKTEGIGVTYQELVLTQN